MQVSALLALVTFAVSFSWGLAQTPVAAESTGKAAYAVIMACPESQNGGKDIQCLKDRWRAAVEAGHDQAFLEGLAQAEKEVPYFFRNCHDAAHEVGRYAVDSTGDMTVWLDRAKHYPEACGFGFVHGVIDAFALSNPSQDLVKVFVQGCLALGPARNDCADGIGHGFWQAYRDTSVSVAACETFEEAGMIASCIAGVGMEQFNDSRNGLVNSYPRYLSPVVTAGLCRQQSATAREENRQAVLSGCGQAAALNFSMPGALASWETIGDLTAGEDIAAEIDNLANTWNRVIDSCVLLDSTVQEVCGKYMPVRVYWSASGGDSPLLEALCPRLGYQKGTSCFQERETRDSPPFKDRQAQE